MIIRAGSQKKKRPIKRYKRKTTSDTLGGWVFVVDVTMGGRGEGGSYKKPFGHSQEKSFQLTDIHHSHVISQEEGSIGVYET